MKPALHHLAIIGIGSPFGADRLGWLASEWLQQSTLQQTFPQFHFTFHQSDRPGAQLLQLLRDCDSAIIIDAMQSGLPAGSLRCITPVQLATENSLLSSHGFGVAEALALGSILESGSAKPQTPQRLAIVGIEMGEGALAEQALLSMVEERVRAFADSSPLP